MASLDKTSPEYRSARWSATDLRQAIDPCNTTYLNRKYHQVFAELLSLAEPRGTLLPGRRRFLPGLRKSVLRKICNGLSTSLR